MILCGGVVGGETEVRDVDEFIIVFELAGAGS